MVTETHLNPTPHNRISLNQEVHSPIKMGFLPRPIFSEENPQSLRNRETMMLDSCEVEVFANISQVIHYKDVKSSEAPLLTFGATATEDEVANLSYFIRTLMPDSVPGEAIGITTGENVFQGFWAAFKSLKRFKQAYRNNDYEGMIEGGTDAVRGVSQSLGGAVYFGYRGVMIESNIEKIDPSFMAATPLGRSAYLLGIIGNVLFGIFYLMIGVWAAHFLAKDCQFNAAMKAYEGDDAALFDFLMRKVQVDPKGKLQKLTAYWATLGVPVRETEIRSWKEQLADVALSKFAKQYLKWQKEAIAKGDFTGRSLTEKEAKATFKELFELQEDALRQKGVRQKYLSLLEIDEADLAAFPLTTLELIGFAIEEKRRQSKREAKFSRVVSSDSLAAVNKAAFRGLKARLAANADPLVQQSAKKELADLKGKITVENQKNRLIHSALIAAGVFGVIVSVLSLFALPPVGAAVLISATLILSSIMMLTDGYNLLEGWKKKTQPGRYDKVYLVGISLVILTALGVSAGLTFGLGLPLLPMMVTILIAGMALSLIGASYYRLHQKQKQWKLDHLDLARFKAGLEQIPGLQDACDEKVNVLFKKLSVGDRRAIRDQYAQSRKEGELKFRLQRFQDMDKTADFSERYLLDTISHFRNGNEKGLQLFIRAMKKTTKFFWEKAAITKSLIDEQRASKMQAFFESVRQGKTEDIWFKFYSLKMDQTLYEHLKDDVWFVVKRNESIQDLNSVVEKVIMNRKTA